MSVQAAILNVLSELQVKSRTSYLLISHDLGVVRYLADRIAVMYLGRIMEVGESEAVFKGPNHPYTEALLSAVPEPRRRGTDADPPRGRDPEPGQPAARLRVQHPLPAHHPGPVRGHRATARRGRARAT